jgi:ABC-2 type transport system permease protein
MTQWGLYFINIGLSGFVVASVAIRFVFPAVSLEARSFYIIRSSPISMREFLKAKFTVYLLPLAALGVLLTAVSNYVIGTNAEFTAISISVTLLVSVIVTGLGVGIGAIYPQFKAENPTAIASSYGGVVYMILSMSAVAVLVALTVWPTAFLRYPATYARHPVMSNLVILLHLFLITFLTLACTWLPLRLGARALDKRE